jgi:hypothetical protein
MVSTCEKQRFSKRIAPQVMALWLFVCIWFPLTHFKSHKLHTEAISLTSVSSDSCSLCLLESLPLSLPTISTTLCVPHLLTPRATNTPLLSTEQVLRTALSTRGPPHLFS